MRLSDLDRLIEPERIRNYALLLLGGSGLLVAWLAISAKGGLDPSGQPIGADFVAFYAASELVWRGQAAQAYDFAAMLAAQQRAAPGSQHLFGWYYPPPFQLLVAPLAALPYLAALAAWVGLTLGLFLALVRRISSHPWAPLIALAFPATLLNVLHGQNGFLNTVLLGFGLLLLDRRPWLAGALLGLLVYKPHFGVLLPLLLAAQGRWKSFGAAAASALALCLASWCLLGPEVWAAFLETFGKLAAIIDQRALPQAKIPTVFVAARELGAPAGLAYAVHGAVALALAAATVRAWRRPGPQTLKVALAVPAILMVSPYAFDYDLMLLAVPIGLLAEHARKAELPVGGKSALVLAYLTPVAFTGIAQALHLQLMPLGVLALYACAWASLKRAADPGVRGSAAAAGPSLAQTE